MKSKKIEQTAATDEGRFAYEGLDRVIHERARLSVLTSLVTNPKGVSFNDLKSMCSLTDGNLSRHLSVLETERMVAVSKGQEGNRPQTLCKMTGIRAQALPGLSCDVAAGGRRRSQDGSRWFIACSPAGATRIARVSAALRLLQGIADP